MLDESSMDVRRKSNERPNDVRHAKLSRRCCDGRTATMAGSTIAHDVATTMVELRRWPGMLQLATALLQFVAMVDNDATALAMLRQRAAMFLFFCFFLLDNFKRKKEWEKERSFETCSLMSRLRWW
jgi:hypothetical protein